MAHSEQPTPELDYVFMTHHYSYVGKRADKMTVKGVVDINEVDDVSTVRTVGVAKQVEHYTVTCDECDGVGRYDELGEIICEGCGMVLSGDNNATLPVDYTGSRGYSEDDGDHPTGVIEPSV